MKKQILTVAAFVMLAVLTGCVRDPLKDMSEEESRIYITNYDTAISYSNYSTFSIADSVAVIQNNQLRSRERTQYDVQFVAAVTAALQQRGFTKVDNTQNPDLGVTISRIINTATGVVSYTDYGGYYNNYWDPYYWGAPGYGYYFPTYYGVYQVSESAIGIDIFDLKNKAQNNVIRSVWSGLIRGSGIFRSENVSSQVMALFEQSPYLRAL
ncbi:MAG TPA: DUF4136 domain-containing protein [Chitinophagaceae bacterium]